MKKITFAIQELNEPLRLDSAISLSQPKDAEKVFSKGLIRKLIVAGAVYVNGKRVRVASRNCRGKEIVEIFYDPKKDFTQVQVDPSSLRVLYEDNALIVFDKPAGLPTQPTLDEARENLYYLAKKYVSREKEAYVGLHHRLDRDTSGVVLFTKRKDVNKFVGDQFKLHRCRKTYVALVHGKLDRKGRIENFLDSVSKKGKQTKFGSVSKGGKKAITEYQVLVTGKQFSLVEAVIETGRTHQIRVHLSELGYPIVGDVLYGSDREYFEKYRRHFLHAKSLRIAHPISKNEILVESTVPQEFRNLLEQR
ncbi:MAG: RluA family pseudouridine synthase [Bacteriovoracia bacterium]